MRSTDIVVVGGGLAGSLAAAMLGRAGYDAVLIDPHAVYPKDFRCEKLDGGQIQLLAKTGLAEAVLNASTPDDKIWIARFGQVVDKRRNNQSDIPYEGLVNAIRGQILGRTDFIEAKVAGISTGMDRQIVSLSNGEEISARLVIMANGLNCGLRRALGIARKELSHCHSVSLGFDCAPASRPSFPFRALTYYPEHVSDRFAYLTLFPMGERMRANLFVYRDTRDAWFKAWREDPAKALADSIPGLRDIAGRLAVTSEVSIRPVDLYVSEGHRQAGLALVGDAFSTSCPAAGTGVSKVFTDAERLCNVHIPRWFATSGMGEDKIAEFYADPVKQACDSHSTAKAFFLRSLSTEDGLSWQARRAARFYANLLKGGLRPARRPEPVMDGPLADAPLAAPAMRGVISQGN